MQICKYETPWGAPQVINIHASRHRKWVQATMNTDSVITTPTKMRDAVVKLQGIRITQNKEITFNVRNQKYHTLILIPLQLITLYIRIRSQFKQIGKISSHKIYQFPANVEAPIVIL